MFLFGRAAFSRGDTHEIRPFAFGEELRDWSIEASHYCLYPYASDNQAYLSKRTVDSLWPWRTSLSKRIFYGESQLTRGLAWWEFTILLPERRGQTRLVFAFVATHNQFVLDRSDVVLKQSAFVITLPPEHTEADYLGALGLLNSSTAGFWLRQVCYPKGGDHVGTEGARVRKLMWDVYFEFDATKLKQFPVPEERPLAITRLIQAEIDLRSALLPEELCSTKVPTRHLFDAAHDRAQQHLCRMVALQEELDWQCYRLYGIVDGDLTLTPDQVPSLNLGERAFEIVLARAKEEPLWFERHGSTPVTEIPSHWPEGYRKLVERRIALIETNRDIALIERPEFKRRWNLPSWREMESAALKNWLLDRMETNAVWKEHRLVSCAQLRDALARDPDWISVAQTYQGGPIEALDKFVIDLVTPESIPHLAVLRYTESGLRKRLEWEAAWNLQRRVDAGEKVEIPVPPKYSSKDMQKSDYWRLRGGLDVPKERFILFPFFQRDSDASPVLGWAGWSYLDQARSLATYYQRMRTEEGWEPERLKPILAGLLDLKPWLLQWHNEFDSEMESASASISSVMLRASVRNWDSPPRKSLLGNRPPEMWHEAVGRKRHDEVARPL